MKKNRIFALFMAICMVGFFSTLLIALLPIGQFTPLFSLGNGKIAFSLVEIIMFACLLFFALGCYYYTENVKNTLQEGTYTGLYTYSAFRDFYNDLGKKGANYTCIIIELSNYQEIYDLFGYTVVEGFLYDVAKKIRTSLKKSERATKIQGNSQCAILLDTNSMTQVKDQLTKLLDEVNSLQVCGGKMEYNYYGKFSIGIYPIAGDEESLEEILNRARLNIIRASTGKEKVTKKDLLLREELMKDIPKAVNESQFVPHFSVRYELNTKRIVGAEIVARWYHPTHGIIKPTLFVPLLELAGYINDLDMYMFRQACATAHEWVSQGKKMMPLTVNISLFNVYEQNFIDEVLKFTHQFQVSPTMLELKIVSQKLPHGDAYLLSVLHRLKKEGFRLCFDSFTAQSFSTEMIGYPFDSVEYDLLSDVVSNQKMKEEYVVKTVSTMCKCMSANMIAQNISSQQQVNFLLSMGCTLGHGGFLKASCTKEEYEEIIFGK